MYLIEWESVREFIGPRTIRSKKILHDKKAIKGNVDSDMFEWRWIRVELSKDIRSGNLLLFSFLLVYKKHVNFDTKLVGLFMF